MVLDMTMITAVLFLVLVIRAAEAETNTGSCKDMLQGYLTGQLASALGSYQVEAMRREFKVFTNQVEKSMKLFKEKAAADIQKMRDAQNSSVVYTRWGKKRCPSNAEIVLSGFTGGLWFDHKGAEVDLLCLPKDPEWEVFMDGTDGYKAFVYGKEYETGTFPGHLQKLQDHDAPCAVCLLRNRSVVKMFPGRKTCYKEWRLEYHGYLMAGHGGHEAGTMYTCVDEHPDTLHGGHASKDGRLFYSVEARCGSLNCPPYAEGRELVCAVCSKE